MRPARRLLGALTLLFALGLAASFWPDAMIGWWVALGLVTVAASADAVAAWRQPSPTCSRTCHDPLPLNAWREVTLALHNPGSRRLTLEVRDHPPDDFEVRYPSQWMELRPGHAAQLRYSVRPLVRGAKRFEATWIRLGSPLGLWQRTLRCGADTPVRVFPNLKPIADYMRFAATHRLGQLGVHRQPQRGEGTEFLQLREYLPGDALRKIDWKATSRQHKLTSREYQEARNQHIVFLLDCGLRMRSRDGALTHFDQTLEAMLMLTHVALRHGDAVGLATFGGPARWLAPASGRNQFHQILRAVYDLQPALAPPDYSGAVTTLLRRQSRRALVILLGNPREEEADELSPALELLQRRHRTVLACVRESVIDSLLLDPVDDLEGALRLTGTLEFLRRRAQLIEALRARHIATLDVAPKQLTLALVNCYLALKAGRRV
ncbi:MAG: DUF58 domain-containing protein [Thiotrichales bacterium]